MASIELRDRPHLARYVSRLAHSKTLHSLIAIACGAINAQLERFVPRLVNALIQSADIGGESKQTALCLNAAKRLKTYGQAFQLLTSVHVQSAIQHELDDVEFPLKSASTKRKQMLAPALYAEREKKVLLLNMARRLDSRHVEQLAALRTCLTHLIGRGDGRGQLSSNQNPFRAEVFLRAIDAAWSEFNPDAATHDLVLPLLRPEVFPDLAPMLAALNKALIGADVTPELAGHGNFNNAVDPVTWPHLQLVSSSQSMASKVQILPASKDISTAHYLPVPANRTGMPAKVVHKQLLKFLSGLQRHQVEHQSVAGAYGVAPSVSMLGHIKETAPAGTLTRRDENTIDLLTGIFNAVFCDQQIPVEIKGQIGFLQIPVLQAALADNDFCFKDAHPVRRVIELLVKLGTDWHSGKGKSDVVFQVIQRSVNRLQHEFNQQANVFSEVVADLEAFIEQMDGMPMSTFSTSIATALRQEHMEAPSKAAKSEIAMRIGAGDVAFFVETFLESKWVSVLTFAHSIEEDKPQALKSVLDTMDDLLWSVKPKITVEERKNLVAKLPQMLGMLNKWLKLVGLDEAGYRRFFSELAECHASIVRAPLKMPPQRKQELAVNIAKQATERRLKRLEDQGSEQVDRTFFDDVETLECGMWLDFVQIDASSRKARLMWVSPMRSVYVFSSRDKTGSFSLSAEDLARALRERRAKLSLRD